MASPAGRTAVASPALQQVQHAPDVEAVLVQPPAVLVQPPAVLLEAGVVLLEAMEDLPDLVLLIRLLLGQRADPEALFPHESHEAFDLPGEAINPERKPVEAVGERGDLFVYPIKAATGVLNVPLQDGRQTLQRKGWWC